MGDLGQIHHFGIISSPVLDSEEAVKEWVNTHRMGREEVFTPGRKGGQAVNLFGEDVPELGHIVHLNKDDCGNDKEIRWDQGIQVTWINWVYGVTKCDNGYVAILNANFNHG